MVELSVEQLVLQFWKLANQTVRTSTVYLLFASVQVFFLSWMSFSYMNSVQLNRKVVFIRCMVELSVEQLVLQFWKLANQTVRTSTVYLLFASVQVFFLSWMSFSYMNSVQLNRKVVFIHMQSSIQLSRCLQSFTKFVQKVCFAFGRNGSEKCTVFVKRKLLLLMSLVWIS